MTSDPRLAYRSLAAAMLAMVMFLLHYLLPDMPDEFFALFSGVYMAAYGAVEVWYDNRPGKKPAP